VAIVFLACGFLLFLLDSSLCISLPTSCCALFFSSPAGCCTISLVFFPSLHCYLFGQFMLQFIFFLFIACHFNSGHSFICVYSVIKYITFSQQFSKMKKNEEMCFFLVATDNVVKLCCSRF